METYKFINRILVEKEIYIRFFKYILKIKYIHVRSC